jgi:hypothetical protein
VNRRNVNPLQLHTALGTNIAERRVRERSQSVRQALCHTSRRLFCRRDSNRQAKGSTVVKYRDVVLTHRQYNDQGMTLRALHFQHRGLRGSWMRQRMQADIRRTPKLTLFFFSSQLLIRSDTNLLPSPPPALSCSSSTR